jgi:GDPmannose 4,6-dehydratase
LMLQQPKVDDFVLATGKLHSVAQLVAHAFECVGLKWQDYVRYDEGLISSVEPVAPCGNPAKAKAELRWENTVSFKDMIALLVDSEMKKIA